MDEAKRDQHFRDKQKHWAQFNYDRWFCTPKGQTVDMIEKLALGKAFSGIRSGHLLDVGAGNGRLMPVYAGHIEKLTAVDISQHLLDEAAIAARKCNIKAELMICDDASRLFFDDAVFDTVLCSRVMQHLYDWRAAIAEFNRVLRPGGYLVLMTYNRWSLYGMGKWMQHLMDRNKGNFRNPIDLLRTLRHEGFDVELFLGAMLAQPSVFPGFFHSFLRTCFISVEHLGPYWPFRLTGERLIVLAKKNT